MDLTISRASRRREMARGEKTRQEILKVAMDIASAEGLEGLTIGRLAQELNMSKSGLFAHFGSKEELQLATIDTARAVFVTEVVEPSFPAERGLARLEAMLEAWLSYVERSVFRGGCFFFAVSAEMDDRPGSVRDLVAELTKAWLDAIEEEIGQAQAAGQLNPKADVALLAFQLHAFVQEANWSFRLHDDQQAFAHARAAIRQCLTMAATAAGQRALSGRQAATGKVGRKRRSK
ncbi:MAG: TetR/AcrR family transcriptional regulator [Blastocatellia bacterium]|nr:TetR/AcrR family transcriptional regulator [Blastocatellia bacterium]